MAVADLPSQNFKYKKQKKLAGTYITHFSSLQLILSFYNHLAILPYNNTANIRAVSGCQDGEAHWAALEPLGILLKYFWDYHREEHPRVLQLVVLRSFSTPTVSPNGLM